MNGWPGPRAPPNLAGRLSATDVVLGARPDDPDAQPADSPADGVPIGRGQCVTAEPLGTETHVSLPEMAGAALTLKSGARVHVFDAKTGKRVAGVAYDGTIDKPRWIPFDTADKIDAIMR